MEQDIEELKRLFYSDRLTQYGKRKLIEYYEQRIKQLEEENRIYGLEGCRVRLKMYIDKNYISKSLVKEKIEELNEEEQELQNSISDEEREEYSDANISFELMDIEIRRGVLQELLEKR